MSVESDNTSSPDASGVQIRTDSLAVSVLLMLGVTVLQRAIGLVRGILFCGMLEDDELGRWSLAFSFLVLAAPLAVMGLPGSLGRYVEHFRQRGQLRVFIGRLSWISSALCGGAILLMLVSPQSLAWLVFGNTENVALVYYLAVALGSVIAFNFLTELFTALRQTRVVSLMQFVASLLFAGMAVLLLSETSLRESAVIIAFAGSCVGASLLAILFIVPVWRSLQAEPTLPTAGSRFWSRLAPFAVSIWLTDLLANLFDVSDRLMLVHFSTFAATETDSLLGQYHAARILPLLVVMVVKMAAAIMLPYLAEAWESGKRETVVRDISLTVKLFGIASVLGGVIVLWGAPTLYQFAFGNKFAFAMEILPLVLTVCIWIAFSAILHNYLQCAEKANVACIALVIGLAVNIALNCFLVPMYSLWGAIVATGIANTAALATLTWYCHKHGFVVNRGLLACFALPVAFSFGAPAATCVAVLTLVLAIATPLLFTAKEKQHVYELVADALTKLCQQLGPYWPRNLPPIFPTRTPNKL